MKSSPILRRSLISVFNQSFRQNGPNRLRNICSRCWRQQRQQQQVRFAHTPADDPNWISVADNPSKLVRTGHKHGPGLILLALIPITAFALGTWQVQRLDWKTKLITKFEDRLIKPPLPLPPVVDPDAVSDFDYRRVYAKGRFRHDQEMLIGPRMYDSKDGYLVVTPFERGDGESTILISRGWISKSLKNQKDRPEGLPQGEVVVEGLLRSPWKKNMFTPDNKPEEGKFYFPDVNQMAEFTGSQPIWVEETMQPELLEQYHREANGIPIGRPPEVNLRNNHTQYIFTWYGLSLATSVMLWMVVRKKPNTAARRIRQSKNW
ncbi:SURF1 family protein [Coccidioides posadasii C735 delta SOWgp]|uniref:SURF1-like protein n=1 Tax=Coccidioides posadasii (strain C735) TaxID=222929 RepID=C5PIR3_COCP7|nr:SURF1 family protein [Coccidioides posadasii C735 delta SOWgp]EER24416.1 SURF1 family protein [Coccidioides posadasii C735 delta SOWgp]|eukprot:XP_003066561.1 SURF1 family protein [Coccidioides posadasii C735 delta SOWgp]